MEGSRSGITCRAPSSLTARLHLHQTAGVNSMRYTTNATGTTATDGLEIGINATQNAVFTQHEGADMIFRVFDFNTVSNANAAVEKMRLTSGGTIATDAVGNYDGLRIWSPINNPAPNPVGFLDLWVSGGNQTHIRWDGSGLIQGIRNRFEVIGNRDGIYFEARRITAGNNPNIVFYINNTNGPAVLPTAGPTPAPTFVGGFIWDGDANAAFDGNFGVNTQSPQNRVEITGNASNPYFASPAGQSGLRLTNLTSSATPFPTNPGLGVLAVDQNGDVIYVQAGAVGAPFGGNCGNTNNMTADWEIPMNGFNYVFSGQGATGNDVGIGVPAGVCNPMPGKLTVNQQSGNTNSKAVFARTTDPSSCAVMAINQGPNGPQNNPQVAGWFQTYPDDYAIVVPKGSGFVSIGFTPPATGPNFTWNNFSTAVPTAMLDVAGSIYSGGQLVQTSDQSLKTNIQPLGSSINKIMNLQSVAYEWITPQDTLMYGVHFGFIAQQVDTVIPGIVHTNSQGLKTLSYTEFIPYLVKALQEEHSRNDSLAQRLTQLEGTVAGCCSTNARENTSHVHNTDVTLTNTAGIVLNQNVPNPFAEQTVIAYQLPDNVQRAQILFYDAQGKLIQTVELTNRGTGQLTVFADDLSSGIYTYALVADGAVVDTKKMVKQ